MTDNEIIKALSDCTTVNKTELFFITSENKIAGLKIADILDLINRLQAENERLKYQVNRLKQYDEKRDIDLHSRLTAEARADAIKDVLCEIIEILHEAEMHGNYEPSLTIEIINDIKKKMRADNG